MCAIVPLIPTHQKTKERKWRRAVALELLFTLATLKEKKWDSLNGVFPQSHLASFP